MRKRSSKGITAEFRFKGKRYCKTFTTKALAEAWERQIKADVERGSLGHVVNRKLGETIETWLNERKSIVTAGVDDLYRGYARRNVIPAFGDRNISEIAGSDVQSWVADLRKARSTSTCNRMLSMLKAFFTWAAARRLCAKNPCTGLALINVQVREIRMLDQEEVDAILAACEGNDRLKGLVVVGLETGMRIGEMMALRWSWIDWARHVIRIPASIAGGFIPKGKKERTIPILAPLRRWLILHLEAMKTPLEAAIEDGDWTGWAHKLLSGWKPPDEGPFQGVNWRRWSVQIRKKSKVSIFHWHMLRHTYISRLVMAGMSLRLVQDVAGHASITTTERYSHLAPDAYTAIVSRFDDGIMTAGKSKRAS